MKIPPFLRGLGERVARMPAGARVALAAVVMAATAVGGVALYRTYDYVQHDNDFCMSCHLMADPYERFAESAHRGLGCKACHQPTLVTRTTMALTQVLENPDSIATHAHVPDERCVECHVEGDPEKWTLIRASAGHRVHMESDDPSLQGLNCVQCHSSSVHQFTATDQTCGQSGCHENTDIQLGKMGQMTIHCAACHEFSRPVPDSIPGDEANAPLTPRRDECLSCHAMRVLTADMPADEPHDQACGACHNPHEQRTPAEAVETCASSGCHTQPDTLTAFHRGLDAGVLENCTACHPAHRFRVEGDECLACHQDIFEDEPAPFGTSAGRAAAPADGPVALAPSGPARYATLAAHPASAAPTRTAAAQDPPPPTQQPLSFSHRKHRDITCTQCHSMEREHGALTITGARECQECHHTAPVANTCATCHAPAELRGVYRVRSTMEMSIGSATRLLPFTHGQHTGLQCAQCHREPLTLKATVGCAECHTQHHEADATCRSCHLEPAAAAHPVQSHLGCAGAGCHESFPFAAVPRTREACLSCHQDLVRHEPGQSCVQCHRLPPPAPRAAAPAAITRTTRGAP